MAATAGMLHEFGCTFTDYGTIGPLTNYEINLLHPYKHLENELQRAGSLDSASLKRMKQSYWYRHHKKSQEMFQAVKQS